MKEHIFLIFFKIQNIKQIECYEPLFDISLWDIIPL